MPAFPTPLHHGATPRAASRRDSSSAAGSLGATRGRGRGRKRQLGVRSPVITGHIGIAGLLSATAKRKFGKGALAALAFASVSPDFLDALFFLVGFCSPYGLYTHTLYSVLLQAAVLGGAAFLLTGSRSMGGLYASAVLLHLAADLLTGQKILLPGGEMHGLYLYNHPIRDFVLESPLVLLGWLAARRSTFASTWMTSAGLLVPILLAQVVFDVTMHSRNTRKPTACFRASTPRY